MAENFTMILVRSFQVVSISQQSPHSLSQTVFVGLFSSLIQQSIGDKTWVSTILHILVENKNKSLLIQCCVETMTHPWPSYYLLDAVGPALADAVPRPDVMCVLSQFVHHGFLRGGQFDVAQVQGSGLITTGQLVAARIELKP